MVVSAVKAQGDVQNIQAPTDIGQIVGFGSGSFLIVFLVYQSLANPLIFCDVLSVPGAITLPFLKGGIRAITSCVARLLSVLTVLDMSWALPFCGGSYRDSPAYRATGQQRKPALDRRA